MAFRKYREIGEVLSMYKIVYTEQKFVALPDAVVVPQALTDEMDFVRTYLPYRVSEAAIGEMVIFPILKEAWRKHREELMLWSHKGVSYSEELSGVPDYLIARQSPLGKVVLDKPLLAVVEAKKDDFAGGWAQCALEMYTMQKINEQPGLPVFGIVSNGDVWQFARLTGSAFVQHPEAFQLDDLPNLYAALTFLLRECQRLIAHL